MTDQSLIVPLRIQFYLSGDFAGQDQLGFSLAAWMIIIMAVSMGLYWMLRKTGRAMAVVDPTGLSAIVDDGAPDDGPAGGSCRLVCARPAVSVGW